MFNCWALDKVDQDHHRHMEATLMSQTIKLKIKITPRDSQPLAQLKSITFNRRTQVLQKISTKSLKSSA